MTILVGTDPNQVPLNSMLGAQAFLDRPAQSERTHALLATTTVGSAVATVDFTSGFDARWRAMLLVWHGVLPATADHIAVRTSADGSAWDSGASNYVHALQRMQSAGSGSGYGASDTLGYINSIATVSATAAHGGSNGSILLANHADTTLAKHLLVTESHGTGSGGTASAQGSIVRNATTAVAGLRILFSGGANVAAGTFYLYGVN